MDQVDIFLKPKPPFDFELTAGYASHFKPRYGAVRFENNTFSQLLSIQGKQVLATVTAPGTVKAPKLRARLFSPRLTPAGVRIAKDRIAWILGIDQDLYPFYGILKNDPVLHNLAEDFCGLHIPHTETVFESLILAILGQQINARAAQLLRTRFVEVLGPTMEMDGKQYYGFPAPEKIRRIGEAGMATLGLTRRKIRTIFEISKAVAEGALNLEGLRTQPAKEAENTLIAIYGVGGWTVQWVLIRALGYTDGFPSGDLALCRILGQAFNAGNPFKPQEALKISAQWSPYRSYMTAYLFSALRTGRLSFIQPV